MNYNRRNRLTNILTIFLCGFIITQLWYFIVDMKPEYEVLATKELTGNTQENIQESINIQIQLDEAIRKNTELQDNSIVTDYRTELDENDREASDREQQEDSMDDNNNEQHKEENDQPLSTHQEPDTTVTSHKVVMTTDEEFAARLQKINAVCEKGLVKGKVGRVMKLEKAKAIYCHVPKAGCTFWKAAFLMMNSKVNLLVDYFIV